MLYFWLDSNAINYKPILQNNPKATFFFLTHLQNFLVCNFILTVNLFTVSLFSFHRFCRFSNLPLRVFSPIAPLVIILKCLYIRCWMMCVKKRKPNLRWRRSGFYLLLWRFLWCIFLNSLELTILHSVVVSSLLADNFLFFFFFFKVVGLKVSFF